MKKTYFIFPLVIFVFLILPWFQVAQKKLAGYEAKVDKPTFFLSSYAAKSYQKQMESWWNANYGSRNTLYRTKNTIYDFLNFNQFHSGYDGNVLQGAKGVLFNRLYFIQKFQPYDYYIMKNNIHDAVIVLSKLNGLLNQLGISMVFIMGPEKIDCREEYLPALWKYRLQHIPAPASVYPIWEQELKNHNIMYVNSFEEIVKNNIKDTAFSDPGTHWTLWGASFSLVKAMELLHQKDSTFPLIKIQKEGRKSQDQDMERDMAGLLNCISRYRKGCQIFSFAEFFPSTQSIPCILLGDSFSTQFFKNICSSKLAENNQISHIWNNENPSSDEWHNALKNAKICFIVVNYQKLLTPHWVTNYFKSYVELTENYSGTE